MVSIQKQERFRPIDIRIPSNAVSITGVLVTCSANWSNCGTVTLQAGDGTDIFHKAYIGGYTTDISDDAIMGLKDLSFHKPWITGRVPELQQTDIAGDNVFIRAWFKGADFQAPFTIRIYLQYEGAEEFVGIEPTRPRNEENEPKSFIL
ncbi:hypothetical protein [Ohtaekwangia koreensis]|nr:hypothetical protein [Ohtaekwangia koreensis]